MSDLAYKLKVLRRIGLIKPNYPNRLIKAARILRTWGPGFPSGMGAAAARYPQQIAIIDDEGELTYTELIEQVHQFTQVLKDRGIQPGDPVALLARNSRYMVIALTATMQVGGRILLLNTMASRSQLSELSTREGAKVTIVDDEFLPIVSEVPKEDVILAWNGAGHDDYDSITSLSKGKSTAPHPVPAKHGQIVLFTSGTTGLPKGAKRQEPKDLKPLLAFFGSIPYRGNSTVIVAAPIFHSWGLVNFGFALSTAATYVLRRRFVAEQVLTDIEKYQARVLVVVPLMMQRLVDADPEIVKNTDVSTLEITASSGSALAGDLALHFMDTFTDSIYNFYGATETGWVTIASPEDLRAAPGTAGTVPWRTYVKVLDEKGQELPPGETGVIYVSNDMQFGGYTDGRTKQFADGLMHSGDLGYFDENGRLFVAGRDDDMIISGGENVFPRELEDLLIEHDLVKDVVVTGVQDEQWGQRLVAYVVAKDGAQISESDLVDYAHENVARFAVPKRVLFLDELPRNPTGKVMKRELPGIE